MNFSSCWQSKVSLIRLLPEEADEEFAEKHYAQNEFRQPAQRFRNNEESECIHFTIQQQGCNVSYNHLEEIHHIMNRKEKVSIAFILSSLFIDYVGMRPAAPVMPKIKWCRCRLLVRCDGLYAVSGFPFYRCLGRFDRP